MENDQLRKESTDFGGESTDKMQQLREIQRYTDKIESLLTIVDKLQQ